MILPTFNDFEKIAVKEIPLIDIRAPIEFQKGAFKNSVNLPLMNDEERHLVGICYKEKGNEEAVKLGHQLVSGKIKEKRINACINYLEKYPNSILYCFRGGQRSKIMQHWIFEWSGKEIPRLEGGYKAFRNYLISQLDPSNIKSKPVLITGYTGSGKTILIKKLRNAIDLEGIANHRGSSFGKKLTPQPTPINFENNLAYALIKHGYTGYHHIILEDEGQNVGKCFLPKPLAAYFNNGELVIVKTSFEERVEITMDEYVYQSQRMYINTYTDKQGLIEWGDYIRNSIGNIKRRLGGDRYKNAMDLFEQAFHEQMESGNCDLHKNWLSMLLKDYYDPMYKHQIKKKENKVIFEGTPDEVLGYIKNNCSASRQ